MKITFDFKSLLLGSVLTVCVILALGASLDRPAQVDRFRITTSANHLFVIDTATGQVWGKYVIPRQDLKNQEFLESRLPIEKN